MSWFKGIAVYDQLGNKHSWGVNSTGARMRDYLGSIFRMQSRKLGAYEFSSYPIQFHPSVAFSDCTIYLTQRHSSLQCSEASQYSRRFQNKRIWFPQNNPLRKSSPGEIPGIDYRGSQPGYPCSAIPHSILSQKGCPQAPGQPQLGG